MKISDEARDHFYKEVGIHLAREGFSVQEQQNSLLPNRVERGTALSDHRRRGSAVQTRGQV